MNRSDTRIPELSVVIPTKDRPRMLPRAVGSILGQVDDVEVIVIDDGSSPENAAAIREACTGDRVRYVRNETSLGAPHGRNQGLDVARGRYWATLDDDDQWLPGKWAEQHAVLKEHGFPDDLVIVSGIVSADQQTPEKITVPTVTTPERYDSLAELFRGVQIAAFLNTYVAPTELMRAIGGYDDRLVWGEHTDVLIRLGKLARFAGTTHLGVAVEREHELAASRTGRNYARKVEGIQLLLDKHATDFAREPQLRSLYLRVLGISKLRVGDRWGAARAFASVAYRGPGLAQRARGLTQLATAVVGGPRLWRWLTRARGVPAGTIG